jgi:hypothetical protein
MLPLQNDYSAFDLIYRNFTGETVNAHQLTFQEAADHDKFWSKFVLCPNGTMEFDPYFIFYYKLEDNVRFVFKINNERNIESVLLPINYVNDVSTKCLEFYNQLLASQAK